MKAISKNKKWDNLTKIGISALLIILIESLVLTIIVLKQQTGNENNIVSAQTDSNSSR